MEADTAAPSTENLIELSKIFMVPVDEILQPNKQSSPAALNDLTGLSTAKKEVSTAKKQKNTFNIIVSVLLAFAVVYIIVLQLQLSVLQNKVSQLVASAGNITYVTVPSVSNEQKPNEEITDYSCNVAYDRSTKSLSFNVNVIPKTYAPDIAAQILVQGSKSSQLNDVEFTNGSLSTTLNLELQDNVKLYLLLKSNDETKTILLEDFYNLIQKYTMAFDAAVNGTARLNNGILTIDSETTAIFTPVYIENDIQKDMPYEYPINGKVEISVNGKKLTEKVIDSITPEDYKMYLDNMQASDTPAEIFGESRHFTQIKEDIVLKESAARVTFKIMITNNFNELYEKEVSLDIA